MENDDRFMRAAIRAARDGIRRGQTPFGACLVRGGRIVSLSHNRVWRDTDVTAHAEILAIRDACRRLRTIDLSGCTIYATCEPCPMCFAACHWARLDRVVYGARIADARRFGFHELPVTNHTLKRLGQLTIRIQAGTRRQECIDLFRQWRTTGRAPAY